MSALAVIRSRANLLEPDVQAAEEGFLAGAAAPFPKGLTILVPEVFVRIG